MSEQVVKKIIELIGDRVGDIAIQGGHFALVHDSADDHLIPGIWQDVTDTEQRQAIKDQPYMGNFPVETFSVSISLTQHYIDRAKIAVLINDWQWVRPASDGQMNTHRHDFYSTSEVPETYEKLLKNVGLSSSVLLPFQTLDGERSHKYFFSESKLRNQYANNDRFKMACPLNNACAKEFVPFVEQLYKQGKRIVINFVPVTCRAAIETSAAVMKDAGTYKNLFLINIYPEIGRESFWEGVDVRTHEL